MAHRRDVGSWGRMRRCSNVLPVTLAGLLVASATGLVGCGSDSGDTVDCGGPVQWTTIEGEVVSISDVEEGSRGELHADVIVRDQNGTDHAFTVWGQPDLLDEGVAYRFEVTQDREAFLDLHRELVCLDGPPRQSTHLDGASLSDS